MIEADRLLSDRAARIVDDLVDREHASAHDIVGLVVHPAFDRRVESREAEARDGADGGPGTGSTKIGCSSVVTVATATKAENARMCPARAMMRGAAMQPISMPPK